MKNSLVRQPMSRGFFILSYVLICSCEQQTQIENLSVDSEVSRSFEAPEIVTPGPKLSNLNIGNYKMIATGSKFDEYMIADAKTCSRNLDDQVFSALLADMWPLLDELGGARRFVILTTTVSLGYLDVRFASLGDQGINWIRIPSRVVTDMIFDEKFEMATLSGNSVVTPLVDLERQLLAQDRDKLVIWPMYMQGFTTNQYCYFLSVVDEDGQTDTIFLSNANTVENSDRTIWRGQSPGSYADVLDLLLRVTKETDIP